MIKDPFEFPGLVIHHNLSAAKHIIAEAEQDRILIDKCLEQVGQDLQYAVLDSEKDQVDRSNFFGIVCNTFGRHDDLASTRL